ncbi:MAG: hypothetical protein V1833_06755, partial [Elusimicrobiota bacterium]
MRLKSSISEKIKKAPVIGFRRQRFWFVFVLCVVSVFAISLAIFSDEAMAMIYHNKGFYTKVCGDYVSPAGDSNGNVSRPDGACQQKCDLASGTCSGDAVFRFECDGKTTDCKSNKSGPSSSQLLNRSGLCGKTVQIDVFRTNCLDGGNCNSLPSNDPDADLQDFIVWYSGDCPAQPTCNTNDISLSVSPSTVNQGSTVNFNISGDASTHVNDNFGGAVSNCFGSWQNKTCTAVSPGNFTWTHSWQHCEGNVNNCSNTCAKSTGFSVVSLVSNYSVFYAPTVDIKANGSDGSITIGYNNSANLSWTSSNANSCTAGNAWSGYKNTSGSESTGNQTYSRTYTITCTENGGSASDSVTVNVENAAIAPTVDIKANGSDGSITIGYNNSANLSWTSSNANSCTAGNAWSG